MAWIESHQELREHPKTKRLCRLLALPRPMVVGYLHFLWWWAYDYGADGDLSRFTDEDIADAIDWEGDPGELVAALTQCGFLTEDRQIHDWEDFAQKWIERRKNDRERKRAGRRSPDDVQRTSDGDPPEFHSLSGVTGPDHTGPNLTGPESTPQPPPCEEGENPPTPRKRGARISRERRNGSGGSDSKWGGYESPSERPDSTPEFDVDPAAASVWNAALEELRLGMSLANFESYLAGTMAVSLEGDQLAVAVSNPLVRETLEQRFRQHILRALLDVRGSPCRVAFVSGRARAPNGLAANHADDLTPIVE